jgi:tRNA nucleotidyltransferase/poly(A) polymerase
MNLLSNINMSDQFNQLIDLIIDNGGEPFLVGGTVRDAVLSSVKKESITPEDLDIEVYRIEFKKLVTILEEKYELKLMGEFGVIVVKDEKLNVEIAIPRSENKVGVKHTDFVINMNPNMDYKSAAMRRDFTINSLMLNLKTGELVDNYDGVNDILVNKQIKKVSQKFKEDPLRFLRAIRFSVKYNFKIESETLKCIEELIDQIDTISSERVFQELTKIANLIIQNNFEISKVKEVFEYWTRRPIDIPKMNITSKLEGEYQIANIILAIGIEMKYVNSKELRKKISSLLTGYEFISLISKQEKVDFRQIEAGYHSGLIKIYDQKLHEVVKEHKKQFTSEYYIKQLHLSGSDIGVNMKNELEIKINQKNQKYK